MALGEEGWDPSSHTVHGEVAGSQQVTLVQAFTVRRSFDLMTAGRGRQDLQASYAVLVLTWTGVRTA